MSIIDAYRNNYAAARLQGLQDDLNITSERYQAGQYHPKTFYTH